MSCPHAYYNTREEQGPDGTRYLIMFCAACGHELSRLPI